MSDIENTGRKLEQIHNDAIEDYQAEAEWHAMHQGNYVLKADYFSENGLEALRQAGWEVYNIEAVCLHECDWMEDSPEPSVDIYVRKIEDVKEKSAGEGDR